MAIGIGVIPFSGKGIVSSSRSVRSGFRDGITGILQGNGGIRLTRVTQFGLSVRQTASPRTLRGAARALINTGRRFDLSI